MAKLNLDLLKHNNLDFSVGIDANGNTTYSLHGQVDLPIPGFKSAGSVSIHFTQDQYQQLKAAGGDFNAVKGLGPFSLSLDGGGNCAIDPQQAFSCSLDVTASGSLGFESDFASAGLSQNLAHCSVQIAMDDRTRENIQSNLQEVFESLDVSATCSSPLLPSQQGIQQGIQHLENRINDSFSLDNLIRSFGADPHALGLGDLSLNDINTDPDALAQLLYTLIQQQTQPNATNTSTNTADTADTASTPYAIQPPPAIGSTAPEHHPIDNAQFAQWLKTNHPNALTAIGLNEHGQFHHLASLDPRLIDDHLPDSPPANHILPDSHSTNPLHSLIDSQSDSLLNDSHIQQLEGYQLYLDLLHKYRQALYEEHLIEEHAQYQAFSDLVNNQGDHFEADAPDDPDESADPAATDPTSAPEQSAQSEHSEISDTSDSEDSADHHPPEASHPESATHADTAPSPATSDGPSQSAQLAGSAASAAFMSYARLAGWTDQDWLNDAPEQATASWLIDQSTQDLLDWQFNIQDYNLIDLSGDGATNAPQPYQSLDWNRHLDSSPSHARMSLV